MNKGRQDFGLKEQSNSPSRARERQWGVLVWPGPILHTRFLNCPSVTHVPRPLVGPDKVPKYLLENTVDCLLSCVRTRVVVSGPNQPWRKHSYRPAGNTSGPMYGRNGHLQPATILSLVPPWKSAVEATLSPQRLLECVKKEPVPWQENGIVVHLWGHLLMGPHKIFEAAGRRGERSSRRGEIYEARDSTDECRSVRVGIAPPLDTRCRRGACCFCFDLWASELGLVNAADIPTPICRFQTYRF